MVRTKEQNDQLSAVTRKKIELAALTCFVQKGFALTSIKDIAAVAGISTGLIYRHFSSKQELFAQLVKDTVAEMTESVKAFEAEGSPSSALAKVTSDLLCEIQTDEHISQYYILMTRSLIGVESIPEIEELRKVDLVLFRQAARLIEKGQQLGEFKSGDPYQMSLFFFSVIQGVADMKLFMGDRFNVPPVEDVMAFLTK